MASEISWSHLPKILFSSLQLKLIGTAQRWAQKVAKHKELLDLLCIVYFQIVRKLLTRKIYKILTCTYRGSYICAPLVADIEDLHECSCFIKFIKRVGEKR